MPIEKDRFKKMVENSPDWFWEFDEHANFTYASPRIRELLGYDPEEIIGLNAFDLMDAEEAARVHRHFDPIARKYLPFNNLINVNRHRDGREVVIESSGTPIFDEQGTFLGYRGIDRDITARKALEDTLRENQALLARTQQIARVGSWRYDLAENRLTWSDETFRIFGVAPDSFDGTNEAFMALVHPEDRPAVENAYQTSLRNGSATYEVGHRIVRGDTGEIRFVHEKCQHERDEQGRVIRSIGMVQDVTARVTSEMALQVATEAAEAANRAKGLFLAKASHEIRTPMTAIVGFGELLENTELSPLQREYLATINSAGRTLTALMDDVLDLSKIDAGELTLRSESFCLARIVQNLLRMQKQPLARKGLVCTVELDPTIPANLLGDPLRIQQVLLNLLANAVAFTERGEIHISAKLAETNRQRILLDVAVADTGIGIPPELQGAIFEPFIQGASGNRSQPGTGLGLAICRSLAGLMGGTLSVTSQVGVGSTFHLVIPLEVPGDEFAAPAPEPLDSLWTGPTLRVLLAEDNPINTRFLTAVLEQMGHNVTVVANGRLAVEAVQANDFDLVLMDIQMPVMPGDEALALIRNLEQLTGRSLKVIALTAYALIGDREKYLQTGFNGYLSKPVTIRALRDEMRRVIA